MAQTANINFKFYICFTVRCKMQRISNLDTYTLDDKPVSKQKTTFTYIHAYFKLVIHVASINNLDFWYFSTTPSFNKMKSLFQKIRFCSLYTT